MRIIPFQDLVRRYFSGEAFVLFDTETSGLNTFHDSIIEIAGMVWQKDGEPAVFSELMRVNTDKISEGAWEIHKIPKEDIDKAREPSQVLADFSAFCQGRTLAAHNVRFDFDMLNANLIRHGLKPYPNDFVVDSLAYAKEQSKPGKLEELAKSYRIDVKGKKLHRAINDVRLLRSVMDQMMKEHEPAEMQYSLIL